MFVCLVCCVGLSGCLSECVFVCLGLSVLSICLGLFVWVRLFVSVCLYLSVCISVSVYGCLSISVFQSLFVSISGGVFIYQSTVKYSKGKTVCRLLSSEFILNLN